jgi:phosphoenolpyruvate synthase/pyruvate phosphate dikinase
MKNAKTKNSKIFNNLIIYATRPFTLQSEEMRIVFLAAPGIKHVILKIRKGVRSIYYDKDDAKRAYQKILKQHLSNYNAQIEDYQKKKELLVKAGIDLEKSISKDNKSKAHLFRKWCDALKQYYIPVFAPFAIEEYFDPECRKLLRKEFGEEADKYFEIISSPSKLNDYQNMRIELIELKLSNKINDKTINKLVKEHCWQSEYSFIEPLLDRHYFINEIKKLSIKYALEEKKKLLGVNNKKFLEVYSKITNKRLKLISKIINDYMFIRTERVDYLKKAQTHLRPFYARLSKELARKTKNEWDYENVLYLLNKEIIDFLESNKIPDYKEAKRREKQDYLLYYDGKEHLTHDKKLVEELQKIIKRLETVKEIKGTIAFKGKVQGEVKLIFNKEDLTKFKEGQILIAKTTMPDYTATMKLAKAIVTDEGGITSHAAITARELHIPCIVGAKVATKSFKDNDIIEVDATKGIVRKLK